MNERIERKVKWHVEAPREAVFPLLCPVREHEWIEGWAAETLYSESLVAELGGIFATRAPGGGREIWHVAQYEPPVRVDYAITGQTLARRLALVISEPRAGATVVEVTLTLTALAELSGHNLAALADRQAALLASRERQLAHFLATGRMLRAPATG